MVPAAPFSEPGTGASLIAALVHGLPAAALDEAFGDEEDDGDEEGDEEGSEDGAVDDEGSADGGAAAAGFLSGPQPDRAASVATAAAASRARRIRVIRSMTTCRGPCEPNPPRPWHQSGRAPQLERSTGAASPAV